MLSTVRLREMGERAKSASARLLQATSDEKNNALERMANALEDNAEAILAANRKDVEASRSRGLRPSLVDRLALEEKRIGRMADSIREVAKLPDPIGSILSSWTRPNGLTINQIRVPLGVVGIIYESRPDVTSDASAICLKSGNAVILKGGSDAINSNLAIGTTLRGAIGATTIPSDVVQVIDSTDREVTEAFMQMRDYVDVLIPRGGAELIKTVVQNSTIPVIETGTGNCHIYVEEDADLDQAETIIMNAKCQRPGTCNAAEKVLVNRAIAGVFVPRIVAALRGRGVEVRGDSMTAQLVPDVIRATDEDWPKEYLDLIIAIKVVDNIDRAIEHINKYGTKHSDALISRDYAKAMRFAREIDSAAVYWNASTRFTDGSQFGLGAEIGVSTQKMHARGPMGIQHLTSWKYFVLGQGQIRE